MFNQLEGILYLRFYLYSSNAESFIKQNPSNFQLLHNEPQKGDPKLNSSEISRWLYLTINLR